MTSNDTISNDNIFYSKTTFDPTYYSSRRIPVVLHRREIGKVIAQVKEFKSRQKLKEHDSNQH
jgi:hypothetical protein